VTNYPDFYKPLYILYYTYIYFLENDKVSHLVTRKGKYMTIESISAAAYQTAWSHTGAEKPRERFWWVNLWKYSEAHKCA